MTENNVKAKKKTKLSKRSVVLISIFIIGILMLAILSLNFTFTYQFKGIENSINNKISSWKAESKIPDHHIEEKVIEKTPETVSKAHDTDESCKAMLNFIQDYYNMKLKMEQGGADFINQLLELSKYKINSTEIKQYLLVLANMATANIKDESFIDQFNSLIKTLYRSNNPPTNIISSYIDQMIFIRPIGDRAIANAGLDMEVALIERALMKNDLVKAKIHIDKLANSFDVLKELQLEIQNKLAMNEALEYLDKIITNKLDCNIVSQ